MMGMHAAFTLSDASLELCAAIRQMGLVIIFILQRI